MNNLLAAKTNLSTVYDPGKALGSNPTWSKLLTPIINNAVIATAALSLGTLLFAGFQYISSDGDEAKIKQATTMLNYAIIGAILAASAWIITRILGAITGFEFFGSPA
jgi:hypothetical protein